MGYHDNDRGSVRDTDDVFGIIYTAWLVLIMLASLYAVLRLVILKVFGG